MIKLKRELKKIGACKELIAETFDELSEQMFHAIGLEFLENVDVPFEVFDKYRIEGTYVDEDVTLKNQNCVLVRSKAKIEITDNKQVYKIVLLHCSEADITISNYAVVLIKEIGGKANVEIDKTSILL